MSNILEDTLISAIALVKHPANRKQFFIVKGGENTVDEILEAIKEICGPDAVAGKQVRTITDVQKAALLPHVTVIKSVYKDLPPNVQAAVKAIAMSYAFATAEETKEIPNLELVQVTKSLEAISEGIKKIEATSQDTDKAIAGQITTIQKSIDALTLRVTEVEGKTGAPASKGAEEVKKAEEKKSEDTWGNVIPDVVIAPR